MIEVQLMSRMGNHFFQYAFAYATAKQLGTSFRIKDWYKSPLTLFVETPSHRYSKINKYNDVLFKNIFRKKPVVVENNEPYPLEDELLYEGYFQSDHFFSMYEAEIKKEFTFKKIVLENFEASYGKLFAEQEVLCVHIRRSDYADVKVEYLGGDSLILPTQYYRQNIENLAGPDTTVLFVSDDIDHVEKEFSGDNPNYRFSKADQFTDFLLLAHAHKLIIANSSFSWWAAYLNQVSNKEIIAPKYYLGFKVKKEWPIGIMHSGFKWVDV